MNGEVSSFSGHFLGVYAASGAGVTGVSDLRSPCPHGTGVLYREEDNALINQVDRFRWWQLPGRMWHKVTWQSDKRPPSSGSQVV